MQEIFFGGNILTFNENQNRGNAMIINDGSVVYVGEKDDVLNLKTDETSLTDLKGKFVYPTLFEIKDNLFETLTNNLKNAKKIKDIQNLDEINEDYENFAHFEEYQYEYLKYEKRLIQNGVSTLILPRIGKLEFAFFKQISEAKKLNIDIVSYVDLVTDKDVMDNNCVTYRKYRNHFRLGGYYLKIDGKIDELKAWLIGHYKGSKTYHGFSEISGEGLYYLLKMALEEKKQLLLDVSGDKAIKEVLTVFEELSQKDNITDFHRPIFYGAAIVDKKIYPQLKKFDITLAFECFDDRVLKKINRGIGLSRKLKFQNFENLIKNQIRFVYYLNDFRYLGLDIYKNSSFFQKCKFNLKMLKNNKSFNNFTFLIQNIIYSNFAYICFDQDKKASLETQKQANFIISNDSLFEMFFEKDSIIKNTYIEGEKKE